MKRAHDLIGPGVDVVGVEPEIDFRQLGLEIGDAVAPGQAASHGQERLFVFRQLAEIFDHLKDGLHGFLHGRRDEGAGVDEHEVGLFRLVHGENGAQRAQQTFGVHAGFGAAKTLGIDTEHYSTFEQAWTCQQDWPEISLSAMKTAFRQGDSHDAA